MTVCSFEAPFNHSVPMVHAAAHPRQLAAWPDECVWWQLKSERYNADALADNYHGQQYLENLEMEWLRRGLCSRCQREMDEPLTARFDDLQSRARNAEDKLGRIRKAIMERSDLLVRPEIVRILDEA